MNSKRVMPHPHRRLAAEERAAALVAGQQAAASRELLSLQSLFKHAVEENRGLADQLQAARERVTQLEAALATQEVNRPPAWQQGAHGPLPQLIGTRCRPPPAKLSSEQTEWDAILPYAAEQRQQAQREAHPNELLEDAHDAHVPPTAAALHGASWGPPAAAPTLPQCLHSHYTITAQPGGRPGSNFLQQLPAISAAEVEPAVSGAREPGPAAVPAGQPQSTAPLPGGCSTGPGGLQQVQMELRALQQRVEAAEHLLMRQAASVPAPAPPPAACVPPPLHSMQHWAGGARAQQGAQQPGAARQGTEPALWGSPAASQPASPGSCLPSRPGSATARQQEHRENWQLIRSLKQRRNKLEAERLAALSATLAASALQQADAVRSPSAPQAAGAPAGNWRFDTQDHPAAAAVLQQPLPCQAVLRRPASATGTWGQRQHVGCSSAKAPARAPTRGRSWETSPTSGQVTVPVLPAGSRSAQGSRGRRASLSAVSTAGRPQAGWCGCMP